MTDDVQSALQYPGPVCACGWPKKTCMKLTVCAAVDYTTPPTYSPYDIGKIGQEDYPGE